MVTAKSYAVCGRGTCKHWTPLVDLRQPECRCGCRFPKNVLLAACLAGAKVEGFVAADEADATWAAAFLKRAGRNVDSAKGDIRDKPWYRKKPDGPATTDSSQAEQPHNFSEYLAAGNLSLSKEQLQHIVATAKAKGMLTFAEFKDSPAASMESSEDADMEDSDNAGKKTPTNEAEHFANRLHYD